MSGNRPDKTTLYYRKISASWWLKKRSYFLFMLRELSSLFIAIFLVVYLVQISQLAEGTEAYLAFTQKLSSPGWIFFHFMALFFAAYHSITWFQSSAVVLPVRLGEQVVSRRIVTALHVGAWAVASLAVLIMYIALKG